jgi:hypothetical protein
VVPVVVSSTTQSRTVPLVVGKGPADVFAQLFVGEDLVDGRAVQVAVRDRARLVRHEHNVTAVC